MIIDVQLRFGPTATLSYIPPVLRVELEHALQEQAWLASLGHLPRVQENLL